MGRCRMGNQGLILGLHHAPKHLDDQVQAGPNEHADIILT